MNAIHKMQFIYDDGGRKAAGFRGDTASDCVVRAIAIATQQPYAVVHAEVDRLADEECFDGSDAEHGVKKPLRRRYIESLGWEWHPTMGIGTGCKVHLRAGELPAGRLIVSVSRHLVAVVDGAIRDTHDCSRDGTRCVYGYYKKAKCQ